MLLILLIYTRPAEKGGRMGGLAEHSVVNACTSHQRWKYILRMHVHLRPATRMHVQRGLSGREWQ